MIAFGSTRTSPERLPRSICGAAPRFGSRFCFRIRHHPSPNPLPDFSIDELDAGDVLVREVDGFWTFDVSPEMVFAPGDSDA